MKKLQEKLKDMRHWPKRAMDRLCMWMIKWATKRRPNMLIGFIMEKASELGTKATMAILDREGIAHCYACPNRFSLRRIGQAYTCPAHIPKPKVEEVKAGRQPAMAGA